MHQPFDLASALKKQLGDDAMPVPLAAQKMGVSVERLHAALAGETPTHAEAEAYALYLRVGLGTILPPKPGAAPQATMRRRLLRHKPSAADVLRLTAPKATDPLAALRRLSTKPAYRRLAAALVPLLLPRRGRPSHSPFALLDDQLASFAAQLVKAAQAPAPSDPLADAVGSLRGAKRRAVAGLIRHWRRG